jgi:hypothetical protein
MLIFEFDGQLTLVEGQDKNGISVFPVTTDEAARAGDVVAENPPFAVLSSAPLA